MPLRVINLRTLRYFDDFPAQQLSNVWTDTVGQNQFGGTKVYVVQTALKMAERCILMTTDPGDLVLDPTCGSGTTATVAEQWGRRWITVDTSRVALALARARVMGARYPWYLLADSPEGQRKEAEITQRAPSEAPTGDDIRQGFVCERVPHITLKSIANNAEIDVIWEHVAGDPGAPPRPAQRRPRQAMGGVGNPARGGRGLAGRRHGRARRLVGGPHRPPEGNRRLHRRQGGPRVSLRQALCRQRAHPRRRPLHGREPGAAPDAGGGRERRAFFRPRRPKTRLRRGPEFRRDDPGEFADGRRVQQAHKEDRIEFTSLTPWPGHYVCAEGRYVEGGGETGATRRAGVFIGPEFGTVARPDLVAAAREAAEAGFDVLIACAFSYDAHAAEFEKLGAIPVLKARMNADLHMAGDLKNTGKGNLFVIFGEPDIDILEDGEDSIRVRINGVDVFHPNTGEVRSDGADGIACWFVDTDYNEESFFVRHAYFLGANDPYKALKTTLKAEIDLDAWATLNSDTSRPFPQAPPPAASPSRSSTTWATRR